MTTVASGSPFGLGIFRYRFACGYAWGHGGDLSHTVNVAVARDGSKAVVTAQNNPGLCEGVPERLYCS